MLAPGRCDTIVDDDVVAYFKAIINGTDLGVWRGCKFLIYIQEELIFGLEFHEIS